MKIHIILFNSLMLAQSFSCDNSNNEISKIEIKERIKSFKSILSVKNDDKHIMCSDTINYKNYFIKISSFQSDSLINEPGNKLQYKYPMLKQIFGLYRNGQLINSFTVPIDKQSFLLKNGLEVEIQNQLLYKIGVIEGENETLFFLESFGGCNSCESIQILVDLKGEIKVLQYIDSKEKHSNEIGNYINEMKAINFDIRLYETNNFRSKDLFCNDDTFELFLGL